jgi:hypothetical protein
VDALLQENTAAVLVRLSDALLLPLCCFAVFGFYFIRNLICNPLDEVQDGGDYLLVRKGSDQERIPLGNVMNVNASTYMNPPRITLRLLKAGRFGAEVSFLPVTGLRINRFAKNPVAEDLIVRAYEARTLRS